MGDRDESALRFEVLGPLRVWRGESAIDAGPVQQRVVLAVLLLRANRPIGRQSLIDAVWGEGAPVYAVNLVQRHISGLRRSLNLHADGDVRLTWTEAGYLLTVPADRLDLASFEVALRTVREARSRGDPATAVAAMREASLLWRGPVCDGLTSPWLDAERDRLAELHLDALEERIDSDLASGDHANAIIELRRLVSEHPLRERLTALLMRALYRSGRQAEALEAYTKARRYLSEELGIDPGEPLRRLHQQILTADPELSGTSGEAVAGIGASAARRPALAQLPHGLREFVGRKAEIDRLNSLLEEDDGRLAGATVIAAISGTAGVGKTSLAVTWAHQLRDRFPDGQVYANLRGFDPAGTPTEPAKAIRGFLDAFAIPSDEIPADPDDQAALYRSTLADRRVLIVLDNARDADQVRPLLPGSPGCLVIVTSRDRLISLVALDGAYAVALDLLSNIEARQLLTSRWGVGRVAAEPTAVDEIVTGCAGLPLALSVIAARAAMNPTFTLGSVAHELREARGNLDVFDGGDRTTNVRAVFACSYQGLSAPAAKLFRLLSLHGGPDISCRAVASLAALPSGAARATLAELARASLVTERVSSRYVMHDLLRAYAGELAGRLDPPADRHAAIIRVLDHYLHSTVLAAERLLRYRDDPVELPPPAAGVRPERPIDQLDAAKWLTVEEPVLLAAVRQASRTGLDRHTWQLAWAVAHHLFRRGHWHEAAAVGRAALDAAKHLSDLRGLAVNHGCVAFAYIRLGRYDDADRHLRQAFDLFRELSDPMGLAHAHRSTAFALDRQGRYQEALVHAEKALELFHESGHEAGEAKAFNAIGWFHSQLGDQNIALHYCSRALELQQKIDDRLNESDTQDSLGRAYFRLGRYPEAVVHYGRAVALYQEFGDLYNVADTQISLGDSQHASGDATSARASWERALTVLDHMDHPDASRVRDRIRSLTRAPADRLLD